MTSTTKKLLLKNKVRAMIGFLSIPLALFRSKTFHLYINLLGKNKVGGPDRFLRNMSEGTSEELSVENWLLGKCHSTLVFSSSWGSSFAWLCRLLKIKSVLRVDGFYVPDDKIDEEFQVEKEYRNFVNKRLQDDLKNFNHIIYQSQFSKQICDEYLYKRENNFSIIPNGTNLELFKSETHSSEKIQIIVLAKHYPKHLNLLVNILKSLENLESYSVQIIGPLRDGSDGVKEYIESLGLPKNIESTISCLGIKSREELPSILGKGDIFLHIKVGDWCPNAVLEAMASGLPVVCPEWGGTKELVGDAGLSVSGEPWSVDGNLAEEMAKAVTKVRGDLPNFKAKARSRVESNFNIKDISKKYLEVLKS